MSQNENEKKKNEAKKTAWDFVQKVRSERDAAEGFDYRRASLAMYGLLCGRCGREFTGKDLSLLTVHHKDGNHQNNPRDGSNWENLCTYCHDDVHSRELLGDTMGSASLSGGKKKSDKSGEMGSMADILKAALKKK